MLALSDLTPFVTDNLGGLKSIGKAGKAVTKQLGKTLTSIAESPDQRGLQKVINAQNPQLRTAKSKKEIAHSHEAQNNLGLDTGKVYFMLV